MPRNWIITRNNAGNLRRAQGDKKASTAREAKGAPGHRFDPDMPADLFKAFGISVLPKTTGRKSKIKG